MFFCDNANKIDIERCMKKTKIKTNSGSFNFLGVHFISKADNKWQYLEA